VGLAAADGADRRRVRLHDRRADAPRAGGDRREVVPDHIGEDQRDHPGGGGGGGEATALQARQVLAHRVQLVDRGPRAEEEPRRRLLRVPDGVTVAEDIEDEAEAQMAEKQARVERDRRLKEVIEKARVIGAIVVTEDVLRTFIEY